MLQMLDSMTSCEAQQPLNLNCRRKDQMGCSNGKGAFVYLAGRQMRHQYGRGQTHHQTPPAGKVQAAGACWLLHTSFCELAAMQTSEFGSLGIDTLP